MATKLAKNASWPIVLGAFKGQRTRPGKDVPCVQNFNVSHQLYHHSLYRNWKLFPVFLRLFNFSNCLINSIIIIMWISSGPADQVYLVLGSTYVGERPAFYFIAGVWQKSNFLLIKSDCTRIRQLIVDWWIVNHAQKPENGPISDLFNLTQNTFCLYCLILT